MQKTSDLLLEVRDHLETLLMREERPVGLLIGVSGGPDSMALLDLLARLREPLGLRLGILHVDYRLRGDDSEEDLAFVRHAATSYGIKLYSCRLPDNEVAKLRQGNLQEKARRIRLRLFSSLRSQGPFSFLALGHHQDDQVETFFVNLLRGAGPDGLQGMSSLSSHAIVRPLLGLSRERIMQYLEGRSLPYREDATNAEDHYLRNRIRNELIPGLEKMLGRDPQPLITRTMEVLRAENEFADLMTQEELEERLSVKFDEISLDLAGLSSLPVAMLRRMVRSLSYHAGGERPSFHKIESLVRFLTDPRQTGEVAVGENWIGRKALGFFRVRRSWPERWSPLEYRFDFPGTLTLDDLKAKIVSEVLDEQDLEEYQRGHFYGDLERIIPPLTLRSARSGDRIQPIGMEGKHKDVMARIRERRALFRDRPALVLTDAKSVLWLVGDTVSERVRITRATERILHVRPLESLSSMDIGAE